jgi:hypothetical protein
VYDYWVHVSGMDAIKYIEVEWQDCNHFVGKFRLKPKAGTSGVKYLISKFGVKSRIQTNIEQQYLPRIMNYATSGHKLQGKAIKSGAMQNGQR